MSEWQPIETAPSDGRRVLIIGGSHETPTIAAADGEWWALRKREGSPVTPTHWMPLPSPPDERAMGRVG